MSPVRLLTWYIIRGSTGYVLATLITFALLITAWDITERIDDYYEAGLSLGFVLMRYYPYFTGHLLIYLLPLFVFISFVFYASRLAQRNEILAMYAAGVSFWQVVGAFGVAGVGWGILGWVGTHTLMPKLVYKKYDFEFAYLTHEWARQARNIHRQLDSETFFYLEAFNAIDTTGYKLVLEKIRNGRLLYRLSAVRLKRVQNSWLAENYTERRFTDFPAHTITSGDSMYLDLPLSPAELEPKIEFTEALTTPKLRAFMKREEQRGAATVRYIKVKLTERQTVPFLTVVLVLLGVSIASKKSRGGTGWHLALGLAIGFSYIFVSRLATVMALNTPAPPQWSIWAANLLYGLVALVVMYFYRK